MAAYSIHIRYTFFPLERSTSKSHPCVYGGKASVICNFAMAVGSPPRIRGKVNGLAAGMAQGGITPAHAGKRRPCFFLASLVQDHPRACGEKVTPSRMLVGMSGSPPRMRGKEEAEQRLFGEFWITPAHAGKSRWPNSAPLRAEDHPRACGEKDHQRTSRPCERGSPPRMRGEVS